MTPKMNIPVPIDLKLTNKYLEKLKDSKKLFTQDYTINANFV